MTNKNEVTLSGRIVSMDRKDTYTKGIIEVIRSSGTIDKIPFLTSQKIDMNAEWVSIKGRLQTENEKGKDGKSHKKTYIFIDKVVLDEDGKDVNEVKLTCVLVRKDLVRETPKGKTIMDIVVAVNDGIHSQYPSCIVWGAAAREVECLPIGTELIIEGRFQSREYMKETEKGVQVKYAYEISVKKIGVL